MRKIRADPYYKGYVELMNPNGIDWDAYINEYGRLSLEDGFIDPLTPEELCRMWHLWREINPDRTPTG